MGDQGQAQIDLVPLRRNRGLGKGGPVTCDILADQIFVGDGIWLRGHVSGSKAPVAARRRSLETRSTSAH